MIKLNEINLEITIIVMNSFCLYKYLKYLRLDIELYLKATSVPLR